MKNRKLVGLLIILFISPLIAFNSNGLADDPSFISSLLGKYKSSFYCDEKITEMTYKEASKYLNKTLVLNNRSLILFTDTMSNITIESDNPIN